MRILLLFYAFLICCTGPQAQPSPQSPKAYPPSTVADIPLPKGYIRIPAATGSETFFLRKLPLKKDLTVYLYNGQPKANQSAQYAVLNMDIGNKDLQQCADAVMRIRAEYLWAQNRKDAIRFRFTNGFICDYDHFAQGYRLSVKGNQCTWVKTAKEDRSYAAFRNYLDLVYTYAGTRSLFTQLHPADIRHLQPGMVFIRTGNPYGHAVTVMDIAYNPATKDTLFLLAQSYMPAQDIHILHNPSDHKLSPWYSVHAGTTLYTPEWTFFLSDLRSF